VSTSKYIDPRSLEALGSTKLRARSVVEGIINGLHRNPHRGSSVEFAEYKEYAPGDEIRHIDWRAYARMDRYYVKQFEDETNVRGYLLLDTSGSMDFAWDGAPSKSLYASTLVAAMAWVMQSQGDAPGVVTFDEAVHHWLPPSSKRTQIEDICRVLEESPPKGGTSIEQAFARIAEQVHSRSIVVLVSDLLDTSEEMLTLARVLRRKGMEVVIFHVMDRAEWELPYENMTLFEGLEGEESLLVEPDDIRDAFQRKMREHVEGIEEICQKSDIEYYRTFTDQPIEGVILELLQERQRASQRGGRR
jgi:uncharacterized protein (DUF58 family)